MAIIRYLKARRGERADQIGSCASSAEERIQPHSCSLATWKLATAMNRFMERSQLSNVVFPRPSIDGYTPAIAPVMSTA